MFLGFSAKQLAKLFTVVSRWCASTLSKKSGHTHVITQKGKDTGQPAIHVIADIGLLSVYGLLSVQKQFLIHFHLLFQSGIGAYRFPGLFPVPVSLHPVHFFPFL